MSKAGFSHESQNAATVEWYTPSWVFDAIGLAYDLDPCYPESATLPWIPATYRYTRKDDGLRQPWFGRVWCNPPYGRETPLWLEKLAAHGDGIALVFSRTDCEWFHKAAETAHAILFFRKRISFVNSEGKPGGSPGAGSVLIAWGAENATALEKMGGRFGLFVRLR